VEQVWLDTVAGLTRERVNQWRKSSGYRLVNYMTSLECQVRRIFVPLGKTMAITAILQLHLEDDIVMFVQSIAEDIQQLNDAIENETECAWIAQRFAYTANKRVN